MVKGVTTKVEKTTVATVAQAPTTFEPIVVNRALDDIQNYADQFQGRPAGRYSMTFLTPYTSQTLSVHYDGKGCVSL
jgi:transposase-like protein